MSSYTVSSGGAVYAGRHAFNADTALMGDSLTSDGYGLTTYYGISGRNGGPLNLLANLGVGGQGIEGMLSRLGNSYLAVTNPGFGGLPPLGWVFFRGGTNNARSNATIASLEATYTSLLNGIAEYADRVIILAVPPLDNAENNTHTITYNDWLSAFAADTPDVFTFIDDAENLRDGSGSQIGSYFTDGIHFSRPGVAQATLDAGNFLSKPLRQYPSPVSSDATDIYPDQPQWFVNPTMLGTGGSGAGGFTGPRADGISISSSGVGMVGSLSKVNTDPGDANQSAWQRIAITSGQASSKVRLSSTLSGRSMTSVDPQYLDVIAELRFTNLDRTKVLTIDAYVQANTGEYLVQNTKFDFVETGTETGTRVLRARRKRAGATTPTSAILYLDIVMRATFGPDADIGTIDIRSITVRG